MDGANHSDVLETKGSEQTEGWNAPTYKNSNSKHIIKEIEWPIKMNRPTDMKEIH